MLFGANVVNSGVSDLFVPSASSMLRLFRNPLPLVLCVVCLCWTMLIHGPSAAASCGHYLHTRQGPPVLHPGADPRGLSGQTLQFGTQHLTTLLPPRSDRPCTGPNCGRSKTPLRTSPAAVPSGTVERDDQCCLLRTPPEPDSPSLFADPDRFSGWLSTDPQPLEMPPDCSLACSVLHVFCGQV